MGRLGANVRLWLCALIIVGSALYAVLVAYDPEIAQAVGVGYTAILLTIFLVINVWKKP